MSQNVFGKSAADLTLLGSGVHRRAHPHAVGAVAVVALRPRRAAQPRRSRPHARRKASSRRRPSSRRARRRRASLPIPASIEAPPATRRITCASSSGPSSRTTILRTGRCARRSFPRCSERPSAPLRRDSRSSARPDCRPRSSPSIPQTGDVLALVGGRDFRRTPFNRAVGAKRQPGSAFKPFLYAAALEERHVAHFAGLQPQRPARARLRRVGSKNASIDTRDTLTLREALYESNNQAAVKLQTQVGSRPVLRMAEPLGPAARCPTCRRSPSASAKPRRCS